MPSKTRDQLEQDFADFHAVHPEVYEWFDHFCREMIAAGVPRFGAPVIWERIRYETYLTTGEAPYRLPNQLRPYYAREFQRRNPDLADRIRTRRLRSRREPERRAA